MRLKFDYIDNEGRASTRIISDVIPLNEMHLAAYCETRKTGRTFNMDRMNKITDMDTGQSVSDIHMHLDMLNDEGYLKDKYVDGREEPADIELKCIGCKNTFFINYFWALHNDKYICECCGKSYTIGKSK